MRPELDPADEIIPGEQVIPGTIPWGNAQDILVWQERVALQPSVAIEVSAPQLRRQPVRRIARRLHAEHHMPGPAHYDRHVLKPARDHSAFGAVPQLELVAVDQCIANRESPARLDLDPADVLIARMVMIFDPIVAGVPEVLEIPPRARAQEDSLPVAGRTGVPVDIVVVDRAGLLRVHVLFVGDPDGIAVVAGDLVPIDP